MAEVLSVPRKPDGQSFYSSSPLKRSTRSYSSFLNASAPYSSPSNGSPSSSEILVDRHSKSMPSSTATSAHHSFTDLSQIASFSSTPASSISFDTGDDDDDDEIAFPSYDGGVKFYHVDEPLDLPPSPKAEEFEDSESEFAIQDNESSSTTGSTRSDSPLPTPAVADDTAVKQAPSRHVDYLSHDWREEDIWSSWRHIVSQRRVYGQRSRLENASWRTWAKAKNHLPTVSPETLNWLKESDVTWLYGPLQPAVTHPVTHRSAENSPHALSNSSSVTAMAKKPILKKRSMSEVMLQRSISASSLVKQAAASVQAQQSLPVTIKPARPSFSRAASDYVPSSAIFNPISRDQLDYFSSRTHSDGDTPGGDSGKRHIRFDDKVEQCIAIDCKDGDHDSDDDEDEHQNDDSDSGSDEGVIMMRKPRRRRATMKSVSRNNSASRIIEKLPDTTLKYKVESPETPAHLPTPGPGLSRSWSTGKLSQSSSSETLKPSDSSSNFLLPQEDQEEDQKEDQKDDASASDSDSSWTPPPEVWNRRDSVAVARARSEGGYIIRPHDDEEDEEEAGPSGLRRTPSGMFMPYEEDEDEIMASELGLLGKVNETINTAKDIAHVIWNVGWRK